MWQKSHRLSDWIEPVPQGKILSPLLLTECPAKADKSLYMLRLIADFTVCACHFLVFIVSQLNFDYLLSL